MKYILTTLLFVLILITGCTQQQAPATPVDCGTDFDCFVNLAETCSPGQVRHGIMTELGGVIQATENSYSITHDERCQLSIRINSIIVDFSDDLRTSMQKQGATAEEVEAQRQNTKNQMQYFVGREGTCKGTKEHIYAILKRWQQGSYSSSDFAELDCSGSYFEDILS